MKLAAPFPAPLRIELRPVLGLLLACLLASALAVWLRPDSKQSIKAPSLEDGVPRQFAGWTEVPTTLVQASLTLTVADGEEKSNNQPYDQTVTRTYTNAKGDHIMLALAYSDTQQQEIKIHSPLVCYPAQGFELAQQAPAHFNVRSPIGTDVVGVRMLAVNRQRKEAVAYWLRTGSVYAQSGWTSRLHILTEGLQGRVPDGILVRASRLVRDESEAQTAYPQLEQFLSELAAASTPQTRAVLLR